MVGIELRFGCRHIVGFELLVASLIQVFDDVESDSWLRDAAPRNITVAICYASKGIEQLGGRLTKIKSRSSREIS